jgi:hypothetical protein
MKKLLTFLTGIVSIIAILVICGGSNGNKHNGSAYSANDSIVEVWLKDTLIGGRIHLEMYNLKKPYKIPGKKVIDHLVTVVDSGYTVIFKNAQKSNITKVHNMRPAVGYEDIFTEVDSFNMLVDSINLNSRGLFKLKIDTAIPDIIVKYEILLTVKRKIGNDEKEKKTTWCIDPYLRIPPPPE